MICYSRSPDKTASAVSLLDVSSFYLLSLTSSCSRKRKKEKKKKRKKTIKNETTDEIAKRKKIKNAEKPFHFRCEYFQTVFFKIQYPLLTFCDDENFIFLDFGFFPYKLFVACFGAPTNLQRLLRLLSLL
jgi:Flp pilus assembly protein TadB